MSKQIINIAALTCALSTGASHAITTAGMQQEVAKEPITQQQSLINQDGGIIHATQPHYPPKAQRESIEGWVDLVIKINAKGQLEDIDVMAANPPRIFEQAAENSVRNWQFKQKIVNGQAVPYQLNQSIAFELINYTLKDGQVVVDE